MGVLHRALLSWFLGLVFLILLVIRLDQRTQWNWFIVFIPMWIFDSAVITSIGFHIFSRCRSEPRQICNSFMAHKLHFLTAVIFKMTLQILICLKLEISSWSLPLYYVFIPLWLILGAILIIMTHHLTQVATERPFFNDFKMT